MAKAHPPNELATRVFVVVMIGITIQITAMVVLGF